MLNPNDYYVQAERRREMERASRKQALIAEIRATDAAHSNTHAPHAQALAKMGDMLVKAGSKLQARYGTLIEEANHTPAEAC